MKRKVCSILCSMLLVLTVLGGCGKSNDATATVTNPTEIYIFNASSLTNSMTEIQSLFAKVEPNVTLVFNSDSSGTLKTQIEEGATCDLFFSAATKQMDELTAEGLVEDGSVTDLLSNKVVLIKAAGVSTKVTGFDNVTNAANIALAGEDVPVGAYAREIFTSIGNLEDVLAMEVNECANVTAVLTAVSEQSNEIGVVYQTDAESMGDSVEIIATAADDTMASPVIYPIGKIVNSQASEDQKAAATAFLSYLKSDEALAVFEKYGFTIYGQ